MKKLLLVAALATAACGVHAQGKKDLVAKVLQLQQPGVESMARQLTEQPAVQLLNQAGMALQQRIPPEKREAVAKDIQADAKKYSDTTVPLVRKRAIELSSTTIGPILEEKFTEDELKQLISILESPVNKKYQQLAPEMQKALGEKLVPEMRGTVEPKLRELEASVGKRLGIAPSNGGGAASAPPATSGGLKPPAQTGK